MMKKIPDIQNQADNRDIPLQKVGVTELLYPITVLDKANKTQKTTATVSLFVNLPHHFKGTHMSRFIEIFHRYHENLSLKHFFEMLREMQEKLSAQKAFARVVFPFFIEKSAPVSGQKSFMSYECSYEGSVSSICGSGGNGGSDGDDGSEFFVTIGVPVATLCPCSKAISKYGAHNQRGMVKVRLKYRAFFWIEDIAALLEKCASGSIYALLKREDEKFVTESAYENPRFVEDIVREAYCALRNFECENGEKFLFFSVEAENYESIHNHNAYAYAEYGA
ncbi:MAG: GTP cyclohydrolase FolE2 [Treponemataceae bacterium]|nr:MAG: GTP cyclohydrolase FolE2 [Treponemataceae bacterium]